MPVSKSKKNKLKYIFVSGGVISGIGKGTTAASIALLLKSAGYKVAPIKFENYLKELKIGGWISNYPFGIYEFDFAFPQLKIYIEIDGSTHLQQRVIEIDKRKDEKAKSEGWKGLRITTKKLNDSVSFSSVVSQVILI